MTRVRESQVRPKPIFSGIAARNYPGRAGLRVLIGRAIGWFLTASREDRFARRDWARAEYYRTHPGAQEAERRDLNEFMERCQRDVLNALRNPSPSEADRRSPSKSAFEGEHAEATPAPGQAPQ